MKHGDFVLMDFVGRIKLTNEIFDLTMEEVAKKEKLESKDVKYEPAFVIIGAGMVVPGVERELEKMSVGDEREFSVSPKDGFGFRDPKMIRIVSVTNFIKNKMNPYPGAYVEIDGRSAKIQSVSGGRVRVDFNSPLAGKELLYKVKIVREVTNTKEKVERILSNYGIKFSEIMVDGETGTVVADKKMPEVLQKMITEIVLKWVKELKKIEFSEEKEHKHEHAEHKEHAEHTTHTEKKDD
jgi:peptidylprolyl isomerase